MTRSSALAAPPPGIPDGWSDGYVYANGIRIHYYHAVPAPGRPVIVMAHGATDIGLCWATLAWRLQGDYDIYMPDARGHGLSDPFMAGDSGETLVKDLVGFAAAMHFEKPVLLGHSMGAATVMRVGAEYPGLAKAIIMLDPMVGAPPGRGGKPPSPWRPNPSDPLGISMVAPPEVLVRQNNYSYEALVAKAHRENPKWAMVDCEYWALSKKQYHGPYTDASWQAMAGAMKTDEALAKITAPALILKADAPPAVRQAQLEAAKVMQRGTLVHIDGAAHNLHHDQLERTLEVLRPFLSKL